MTNILIILLLITNSLLAAPDPPACQKVRMADIGWTDVTATTAIASELLTMFGYEPQVSVLSTPVTFAGIKNNDIDVFLGNWMPTQEADIRQYLEEGSVVQLKQNLSQAVFTLAVPNYVYDSGVRSFADIARFKDQFKNVIYGIEPGNDGNRLILQMIEDNAFDLRDFRLIESSEQGMLVAVNDAIRRNEFIVFLGWAPHPMNLSIQLKYLSGGDQYFGPNLGSSQVYTVTRRHFASDCPNLARFFENLTFSLESENQIMSMILTDQLPPSVAAKKWLQEHSSISKTWLTGVTTFAGLSAQSAFDAALWQKNTQYSTANKAPIGQWIENGVVWLTNHFAPYFRALSKSIEHTVAIFVNALLLLHWALVITIFALLVYFFHRSLKLVLLMAVGLLLIVNLGLWVETIQTLVLVMFASVVSVTIGIPLGVMAARHPIMYSFLRPVLDLMQTIPTFVYLIPTLMLFGLGMVPGLISTVVFAIAAPIRLTYLGITSVPKELIEASESFGATKMQTLIKVEMPCAMPFIMSGFTQCIMLSLSMVVIAALVGADGLGTPVVRALNTVNIELGFESGLAIVILAILLDRSLSIKKTVRTY